MNILSSTLKKFRDCFVGIFSHNTDASIELIDALSCNQNAKHPIELTLDPRHKRHHTSLSYSISSYYKPKVGVAKDYEKQKIEINKKIENTLCQHIDKNTELNFHVFAIDVTPYKRTSSKKVKDKSYIHVSEAVAGRKPVSIGHKYSCVAYLTEEKPWTLPLSTLRVTTSDNESVFGVRQWTNLINDKNNGFDDKISVGVFDSAYSNAYCINEFIKQTKNSDAIFVSRLRCNRILMRPYEDQKNRRKLGRKPFFEKDRPFELKNKDTWGEHQLEDNTIWKKKNGKICNVNIRVWNNLRMRGHKDCPIQQEKLAIIRIYVTNTNGEKIYKNPLWLVSVGKFDRIGSIKLYWEFYHSRFDIEHLLRFGKQRLLLTSYQTCEVINEENWMLFPMIAYHQLYHGRQIANHLPRAWEKQREQVENKQTSSLSPTMVQRDMPNILKQLPEIVSEKRIRGIPIGRQHGDKIGIREDQPVIKKTPYKKTQRSQIRIIVPSELNSKNPKTLIKYDGLEKDSISSDLAGILNQIEKMEVHATSPPA